MGGKPSSSPAAGLGPWRSSARPRGSEGADLKATAVTPNLIQLTRFRFVNAYLVREADGFTLVDTTLGRGADGLIAAAAQAGRAIRRIALTHARGDHVGSLDALAQRLGDSAQVLMPELDARIHAGEKVVEGNLPGSWPTLETRPDVRLAAGDHVGSLEVVASPGHSPGHVAFLDTRDRTVIGGDVFTSYGRRAVTSHFYLRFPLAAMATWDKAKNVESARALRDLDPPLLVVGHGPALRSPRSAIDDAIVRAEAATGAAKVEARG
jgi:glyoxylase-like metal-dependent hydrolase (beta-lactamase superfamily II)